MTLLANLVLASFLGIVIGGIFVKNAGTALAILLVVNMIAAVFLALGVNDWLPTVSW
jgi:hypothetical protein